MRPHDRLCLVVISDRREFWSREDDQRRARAIADELRAAGMELPRLRWIRQSRTAAPDPVVERRAWARPAFWLNASCGLYALFVLSWRQLLVYATIGAAAWALAFWLTDGGGWARLKKFLPFVEQEK